jgi:phosphoglucosamine mutase
VSRRYFGTDGIRGVVGRPPLEPLFVTRLGLAVGRVLTEGSGRSPRVLLGRDTRASGDLFAAALASGLAASGATLLDLGVVSTPALALLVRLLGADAGFVVSASHNPYDHNGIKCLGPGGTKLDDAQELEIERRLRRPGRMVRAADVGRIRTEEPLIERYLAYLRERLPHGFSLSGWHLAVDTANGATYALAPAFLRDLGARVTTLGDRPDGSNINEGCGVLHPEAVREAVRACGADLGITFDGDGDRVHFVTAEGELVDGDAILYLLATDAHERGRLGSEPVVGTVMSNLGLEEALGGRGIRFLRSAVGDRYVLETLLREGGRLGGENSGHVLLLDDSPSGDGLLVALRVLEILTRRGRSLGELLGDFRRYPQRLLNVPLPPLPRETVLSALGDLERRLRPGAHGRVLLRLSGTEPLVRIMVEGPAPEWVEETAELARAHLAALASPEPSA